MRCARKLGPKPKEGGFGGRKIQALHKGRKSTGLRRLLQLFGVCVQAIRVLGCPTPGALLGWAREDPRYGHCASTYRRYTGAEKAQAVNAYYGNGENAQATCMLIGHPSTVCLLEWAGVGPRCRLKSKGSRRYTAGGKVRVVSAYLGEAMSYGQAAALVGPIRPKHSGGRPDT